ncbi:alpha/beta fold hydrolase [Stratiformator vulcanicus]|uniref:Alpha/beta hydrolase family protein n=1 Tax=Stratiformator vulcanicus TaxID=2527980 RepID=A0A517R437_9PLAN|nr:alpha/beta fold hydrolase [Stratiformator vulcanicus]QDT38593.1 Alpha/beta hydrolase family protein [Stratiformator vulcanicus]
MTSSRLILFPPPGADERLVAPQREAIPDLIVPEWLQPEENELLADYADRLVEIRLGGATGVIDKDEPIYVGGISFGGPVAIEVTRQLQRRNVTPRGLLLVGSVRHYDAIPEKFRLRQDMRKSLPARIVRDVLVGPVTTMFTAIDRLAPEHIGLVRSMAREADLELLGWAAEGIAKWSFTNGDAGELTTPLHQIHGERDRVLPVRAGDADVVIAGGGHLINLSNADEVNRFLLDRLEEDQPL